MLVCPKAKSRAEISCCPVGCAGLWLFETPSSGFKAGKYVVKIRWQQCGMEVGRGVHNLLILIPLCPEQHPVWDVPHLWLRGFFFSSSCQQCVGKTHPLSWVQAVRRISGPGFGFFGSRGCPRLLAAEQVATQRYGSFLAAASWPDYFSWP